MFLFEFFNDAKSGYQDLSRDQSVNKMQDTRNTRLTLRQINQLRKMNDQRMVEFEQKLKIVQKQYADAPAPAPGL